ncbi:MAG: hypothetical protein AUJ28_03910 [Parcubacteria group bacterium CG1_02_37_51]|uniref:Uncharacterized protein n=2 Tax=Candidatus Komeiliibacteriota TaxID=1817908 RepID=A0A2M8DQY3_9BACT|nr:MAG: hypothetical protein AUJ28_03910 [Parcubacteria group bacterium CG1_02_37_51]PIY94045.1 MAG: hypothetical protein COY67_03185 [Candidatus Komeilibacteria bacterium CG_4_10_14_0_8_um_filter_37_78]PJC01632.1 MAG: hypothetical protein CO073_03155 [Candidatus Komeilibacteria bacterium CG_4_9_14_0_8_um_filter_36_9]
MILVLRIIEQHVELKMIRPSEIITSVLSGDKNILLNEIDDCLNKYQINKDRIEAVAVIYNEASFSLIRILTSIANSLAWSLNIPIYKIIVKIESDRDIAQALKKVFKQKKVKSFILPEYYKEPNITKATI